MIYPNDVALDRELRPLILRPIQRTSKIDILLLYIGTSEYWTKDENIKYDFTYIEPSAARWIVDHHVKCVGIDTFGIEKYGSKEGLSRKILLSRSVGIMENGESELKFKECCRQESLSGLFAIAA